MKKDKENKTFNKIDINLKEFKKLNINEKNEKIRDILADAMGSRKRVKSDTILKIINFSEDANLKSLRLNRYFTVSKDETLLTFSFAKSKLLFVILFYILLFGLLSSIATYSQFVTSKRAKLNIDIDNDGVAELNIDINKDSKADINIDTNNDSKPDHNIDYKGNWKSIFNIYKDGKIYNKINQKKDGKCYLNCDTNNDGWPDINLDIDGDGKADLYIDSENKGYATLNIDADGDMVCDIQCDKDGDGKCDDYCLDKNVIEYITIEKPEENNKDNEKDNKNNNVLENGHGGLHGETSSTVPLLIVEGQKIECFNLFPTDQPQENVKKECTADLKVTNSSTVNIAYNLDFIVSANNFTSSNFKYKITSTNGGGNLNEYTTAPKVGTTRVFEKVTIAPLSTQVYHVSFILQGMNEDQSYDALRTFDGVFKITINNK